MRAPEESGTSSKETERSTRPSRCRAGPASAPEKIIEPFPADQLAGHARTCLALCKREVRLLASSTQGGTELSDLSKDDRPRTLARPMCTQL
ncbi:hypothetical protein MTO96_007596 [Rhipicephalus appendiculatus]